MVIRRLKHLTPLLLASTLVACASEDPGAAGLNVEVALHGPSVVFDPLRLPDPEVPFPNDLSLRAAAETASGYAWNLSGHKASEHRRVLFDRLDKLDGFGTFAPVMLPFDGPLALDSVDEASVMIINIDPSSARYGEHAPLDLGKGYYPSIMELGGYFGQDPNADTYDLVFPVSNWDDLNGDGVPERLTFYEAESNTLLLRPLIPLAEKAKHAVLITRNLEGWRVIDGVPTRAPVRSPFPYKAHAAQAEDIRKALVVAGMDASELAFGWTYTTADLSTPMVDLRRGMYGEGPMKVLADKHQVGFTEIRDNGILHDALEPYEADPRDSVYTLTGDFLGEIFGIIGGIQGGDSNYDLDFPNVAYVVFGSVEAPELRTEPDKAIGLDFHTGEGEVGRHPVPFLVTVPKTTERFKPPFPVMFYFHGTGTSRMESLAIADAMGRQGVSVVAFDQVGHGPLIPDIPTLLEENPEQANLARLLPPILAQLLVPHRAAEFNGLDLDEALAEFYKIGFFAELAVIGRSVDANGDGRIDIAEDFFSANPFRQCASFQQDMVDFMSLVQAIRGLRQADVPAALDDPKSASVEELMPSLLAGDFNADGVLDIGGPDVALSAAGTSLGGFHSILGAALEPEVTTVTPIVAGGGFADIMTRSGLRFITERLFLEVFGTVVVGCPDGEGKLWISQGNDADECKPDARDPETMQVVDALEPGTPITLYNDLNGEWERGEINAQGGFSISVESDKGDALRLRLAPWEAPAQELTIISRFEGSGYHRNSTRFRRAVGVQQHVFDRCDPITFARRLYWDPLPGYPPTNVLFFNALGDDTVPASTGVNVALAAGVFGKTREEWAPRVDALIAAGVLENGHFDVDDARGDNPPETPGLGVQTPEPSATGVSSVRFGDVNGKHEYIAGYTKDDFNFGHYHQHILALYHRCEGRVVVDQPVECLGDRACELLDTFECPE
jgi:hypothetical protein